MVNLWEGLLADKNQLPRRNKLAWMDEVLWELCRDEAVRELTQHIQNRVEVEMEKIKSVSDVVADLMRM